MPGIFYHTVRPGETLSSIAKIYECPLSYILRLNPGITNPDLIYPGDTIAVSAFCHLESYVVQPGDTLYTIATSYGLTMYDILLFNDIPNPYLIYLGQELLIPTQF